MLVHWCLLTYWLMCEGLYSVCLHFLFLLAMLYLELCCAFTLTLILFCCFFLFRMFDFVMLLCGYVAVYICVLIDLEKGYVYILQFFPPIGDFRS